MKSNVRRFVLSATVTFALLVPSHLYAVPVVQTDGSGKATGIANLEASGLLYNISFTGFGQSFTSVFAGTLDVTSQTLAGQILEAIETVLNGSLTGGVADWQSTEIAGNSVANIGEDSDLFLPHNLPDSLNYEFVDLDWRGNNAQSFVWEAGPGGTNTQSGSPGASRGWVRVAVAVPEPAPWSLMMLGLAAVGFARRQSAGP